MERILNSVVYGQTIPCPSKCVVVVRLWQCHESSMGFLCSCVCFNILVFLFKTLAESTVIISCLYYFRRRAEDSRGGQPVSVLYMLRCCDAGLRFPGFAVFLILRNLREKFKLGKLFRVFEGVVWLVWAGGSKDLKKFSKISPLILHDDPKLPWNTSRGYSISWKK